jgi:tetratricopeptide (TPR) repeat protein
VWVKALPVVAIVWIAVTVLPQRRIWEYHNALAGGTANAWLGFQNESVDLGQRSDEMIAYYRAHIAPEQLRYGYWTEEEQLTGAGVTIRHPKPEEVADGYIRGWQVRRAPGLPEKNWEHIEVLRGATPTARFGNMFIYHQSFYMPVVAAQIISGEGRRQLFMPGGDKALAEKYFRIAIKMAPDDTPSAAVLLANICLNRHQNAEALGFYKQGLKAEKNSAQNRAMIAHQVELLEQHPNDAIPELRWGKE